MGCPIGTLEVSCWGWEVCGVAVHDASGDTSWWGAQFSWMIAGRLIFDLIWVGFTGFEVVVACDRAMCKGEGLS